MNHPETPGRIDSDEETSEASDHPADAEHDDGSPGSDLVRDEEPEEPNEPG